MFGQSQNDLLLDFRSSSLGKIAVTTQVLCAKSHFVLSAFNWASLNLALLILLIKLQCQRPYMAANDFSWT